MSRRRDDIQGVRAVAVLLVLGYHLAPGAVPAGFVGVDVFFVLSGFLVTSLLVDGGGTLRGLGRFLVRRARRLLPAAGIALAATLLAGLIVLPRSRWNDLATQVIASSLQVENWFLIVTGREYSADHSPSAVQHFWSLSVEWQTYLLWVALFALVGLTRLAGRRRLTTVIVGVIAILSLAATVTVGFGWPSATYLATPGRIWQFGAGALLALFPSPPLRSAAREVLAASGLAAIVASAFLLDPATHPGLPALAPVLGTCAVLVAGAGDSATATGRALSVRPLTWIGDRSYEIYLWHWPILVLLVSLSGHPAGPLSVIAILVATLVISSVSLRWIDDPLRRRLPLRPALALVATCALLGPAIATPVVVSTAVLRSQLETALDPDHPGALALDPGAAALVPEATMVPDVRVAVDDYGDPGPDLRCLRPAVDPVPCAYGDVDADRVLVLAGDSHAWQWLPTLDLFGTRQGWRIETLVRPSCPLAPTQVDVPGIGDDGQCALWRENAINLLVREKPDVVLVGGLTPDGYETIDYHVDDLDAFVHGYIDVWDRLASAGIRVGAFRDTPYFPQDVPACVSESPNDPDRCAGVRAEVLDVHPDPIVIAAQESDTALIDLSDAICLPATCPVVVGNVLVYRDRHHLTATYGRTLEPALARELARLGLLG
ncbi:MAG: acyltransferase family protein [Pseudolysinimonas sp.]|uniref:acyltransferase family protein n=1 Tax=Pseudolysinimonas sp. TaxID=2680009 RepID=UPI0032642469